MIKIFEKNKKHNVHPHKRTRYHKLDISQITVKNVVLLFWAIKANWPMPDFHVLYCITNYSICKLLKVTFFWVKVWLKLHGVEKFTVKDMSICTLCQLTRNFSLLLHESAEFAPKNLWIFGKIFSKNYWLYCFVVV